MPKKFSEIFSAAELLAKIIWKSTELFAIFYQIVKIETLCLQKY